MHETPVVWIGMQVIIMCVLRFLFAGLCFCKNENECRCRDRHNHN